MKIPFNISATTSNNRALVRIIGEIGWETDSESFRSCIDEIISQGVTEVDVYINSPGGSVFDANEIVNILSAFSIKNCIGGALVASAGAFIACSCDTFEMPANGMLMIHRPSGAVHGKVEDFESYLKLLTDMQEAYRKLFVSKAKDKKEFEKFWNTSDWWLNAQEAKDKGFATAVKANVKYDKTTTDMLAACGCPSSKYTISTLNKSKMELLSFFKSLFGLADTATEQDAINSVTQLQRENKTLKQEKASLEQRFAQQETDRKAAREADAENLLNTALKDGRLDTTTRAVYEKLFASDHDAAKAALEAIPRRQGLSSRIGSNSDTNVFDKSWDELDKAGLLARLRSENNPLYREKFKSRFGNYPSED